MEKTYIEGFRDVLRRLNADSNRERYVKIVINPSNDDEVRIWQLCRKFWPEKSSDRDCCIDNYVADDSLDEYTAKKYLSEISELLDKLGWD